MSNRIAKFAGVVALLALAAALAIWEFGGGSIRIYGTRVSASSWGRPFMVAIVAGFVFTYYGGRAVLEQWISQVRRRFGPPVLAGALCLICAVASFFLGTHVASGSDSYGYISQADLW